MAAQQRKQLRKTADADRLASARDERQELGELGLNRPRGFTGRDVELIRWLIRRQLQSGGVEAARSLFLLSNMPVAYLEDDLSVTFWPDVPA